MGVGERYQQFLVDNASLFAQVEGAIRSISYLIPGRFTDSEFAAEVLYSALNLLRLANDSAIVSGKGDHRMAGEGISRGAWNAYLGFLRRQSRFMNALLTFLNVAWTIEVPLEMLVQRLLGATHRLRMVVILELCKAMAKFSIFLRGNWRPLLRQYLPDVSMEGRRSGMAVNSTGEQEPLLSEIKVATAATQQSKQAADGALRAFLRQHRIDQYVLVPELALVPVRGIDRLREVSHILRPLVYVLLLYWSGSHAPESKGGPRLRWIAWGLTLLMDVFSEWPQLAALLPVIPKPKTFSSEAGQSPASPMQKEEHQVRLLKLLLYLLREPLYSTISRGYLDSVIETLSKWRLLRPAMDTAKSYQRLCEKVIYYTLGD